MGSPVGEDWQSCGGEEGDEGRGGRLLLRLSDTTGAVQSPQQQIGESLGLGGEAWPNWQIRTPPRQSTVRRPARGGRRTAAGRGCGGAGRLLHRCVLEKLAPAAACSPPRCVLEKLAPAAEHERGGDGHGGEKVTRSGGSNGEDKV
jgi:hypothetical protein